MHDDTGYLIRTCLNKETIMNKILIIIVYTVSNLIIAEKAISKEIDKKIYPSTVIAEVNGKTKRIKDLLEFIPLLPPQLRQQPLIKNFHILREQMIYKILLEKAVEDSKIELDPEIKKFINNIKKNALIRSLIDKIVQKKIKEENIEKAYLNYVNNFPKGKKEDKLSEDELKEIL